MTKRSYYAGDEKVEVTPSTAYVAVQASAEASKSALIEAAANVKGLRPTHEAPEVIEPLDVLLLPLEEEAGADALDAAAGALASEPGVERTLPVFQMPGGERDEAMVLIPRFRAQFKPGVTREQVDALNAEHGVEVVAEGDLGPGSYLLRVRPEAGKDALDLSNLYHESDLTEYAEPDWVYKMHKLAAPVDDPHFDEQWALEKMRVPQAWGTSKGRTSIKIAIVDEGVQTSHEDLASKIVTPYDAVGDDDNQEPLSWDGHGTACAGIAAAATDNGKGVAGVAPECKILPIRIAYSSGPLAGWITNTTWIARGLRQAVNRGADVISNSWGGGPYSATIRDELKRARVDGRGGKGCVVISATGNSDVRNVAYPAKYPESLACGASNQWDRRKSKTSADGESRWGSNYGPEVDFVAPGVKIYTTDITGAGGYNAGSYYPGFNGTSSATPNAAGVAALVLSVDPALRQWEVRDILRLTAKDLGTGGKDEQFGWGRIDAEKAVQAAARLAFEANLRLEFLGSGEECYMRFRPFRLYNSGLNTVRVNHLSIRSYDSAGREIDRFEHRPNPGAQMLPGLASGGGSGHDLTFEGLLLKASGDRRRWSYRWSANWSYTFWRPSAPVTSPSDAAEPAAEAVEETQEYTLTVEGPGASDHPPQVTIEEPEAGGTPEQEGLTLAKNGHPVKVTILIE